MSLLHQRRAGAYAAGDPDALVRTHAPLVRRIAHQIASRLPPSIEIDDLVQEGMVGLLDAIRRWQPQPGEAPFVVYARMRVRGAMVDWLRRHDLMPRHQRDRLRELAEATTALGHQLGRAPDDAEIAEALGMDLAQYHAVLDSAVSIGVVDELPPEAEPEAGSESDPLEQAALRQIADRLQPLLQVLPPKEQQVLALHYTEHLSYREIAYVMGLTAGRISQLHSQAMLRLRGALGDKGTTRENR